MRSFFFRVVFAVIIGFFLIIIISKFADLSGDVWRAHFSGIFCALFYVISGFFTYYYASKLSQRSFTRIFLLSTAGRFLLVMGVIALVIKFSNINTEVFIVSFFIYYFVFQILEVISLNRILKRKL
jgi:hypothetical protein